MPEMAECSLTAWNSTDPYRASGAATSRRPSRFGSQIQDTATGLQPLTGKLSSSVMPLIMETHWAEAEDMTIVDMAVPPLRSLGAAGL